MLLGISCAVFAHALMVDPMHRTFILFNSFMHVRRPIAATHLVEMLQYNKRITVTHRYSTENNIITKFDNYFKSNVHVSI